MLKEKAKGFFVGIIATVVFAGSLGVVFAEQTLKVIDAVYMNIKLFVDGERIEPEDASGNFVEPFIYNGTTYLPVRAVGQAFNKDVHWDGDTATVYIGGVVDKPAKDVFLFSRPYIENSAPSDFKSYEGNGHNYVGFSMEALTAMEDGRYIGSQSVVYPLNGVGKKVTGTLLPGDRPSRFPETVYKFYNESGKMLYQSPKMIPSTSPIGFEIDVTNCISLKVEIVNTTNIGSGGIYGTNSNTLLIQDFILTTMDYK